MVFLNDKPLCFSPHVHIQEPTIITSWAGVQRMVREGKAKKVFSIGDQLQCEHGDYGVLTWDIIGIDHDEPSDLNFTHSITLQLHDCTPPYHFKNHATNYDTWKDSLTRYWLNTPTDKYVKPSGVSSSLYDKPFTASLDEDFLEVVGEVVKATRSRDASMRHFTNDKFFLLSCEEVYGVGNENNYGVGEGVPYQYYLDRTQHGAPSCKKDNGRIKYRSILETDDYKAADCMWLRSPKSAVNDFAVFSDGSIDAIPAYTSHTTFIAPACCIY